MPLQNNQAYYEDFFLLYLYKVGSIDTEQMEPLFDRVEPQLVNNVISNRTRGTSHFVKGWLKYDTTSMILEITNDGRKEVERRYHSKRG